MRDTSLHAYDSIRPQLQDKEREVLSALATLGMATNQELADFLGWEINRITGRTNGLEAKEVIEEAGKVRNPVTHRLHTVWKVRVLAPKQMELPLRISDQPRPWGA